MMNPALIDALVQGELRLTDAWVAEQRETLSELLAGVGDPLLYDAVKTYRPHVTDDRVGTGLDQLLRYAPAKARLSWLKGGNVSHLYRRALETRKPNTVYRSLHRAVRELLDHHLDAQTVRSRMERVKVPGEKDERNVRLTPAEIRRVVDSTPNDRFGWMVALAMLTAIDRSPLLRLTPRHYDNGTLRVPDKKTKDRRRDLRLSEPADTILRLACMGLGLDERLFDWTVWQVRKLWDETRERAELPSLRFKDLRHLLPGALAQMGVDRKEIQSILGHAPGSRQTDRYIAPTGDVSRLDAAAEMLGLMNAHLRLKEA